MRHRTTRHLTLILLASVSLAACGKKTAPAPDAAVEAALGAEAIAAESDRLNQWFDAKFEEQLDFSPIQRTFLGDKKDYDKIDDLSEAGEDAQLAWMRAAAAEMKSSFDYDKLSPEAKTSYDVWLYQLDRAEAAANFRRDQYVFTQMQGPQAFLPQFLIVFHKVDEPADMDAYVARIGGVARGIDQLLEQAKTNAAAGARPPLFAYEGVIAQSKNVIAGAPFTAGPDSPVFADVKTEIKTLLDAGKIDAAKASALEAAAKTALVEKFGPSYQALIDWFEADKANADKIATGVGKLPNGKAFYEMRLASATTTDITPDEVHAYGLSEVARLHGEMEKIKEKVGYKGTLQEFFTYMRDDDQFFYPDTDEGRQAYIDAATAHLDFIKAKLPDYFGILPKADLVVKRVEPFREQKGAAQHYFQGTPDGSRPGVYYAHLSDMRAMPKPQLEVVAYHEGLPGHHMQISIAQEATGVPKFRTQAGFTAYSEGWGLYSELLAKEMGAYEDPYSDFGRLSAELWRAIRLVIDSGVHAKGWTEQQAVDYFLANSPSAEGAIRSEVQRYIVWPGQATAYKIGMRKILEVREKAKAELGEKFDIKGFHDTVLGGGALPLGVLERRVDEWVAAQKA
ncbi:MAG: hypothetical protein A3E78_01730 [Alphaproteobacteria bacterium RIFCSPHIGHO2_12_FULL_63_12]|nr:MAG: hypothetical protein A3E78_01730 [Alphaproteobacteria bacterium RIFCSPHIGHO2_12_FULL_63_12]